MSYARLNTDLNHDVVMVTSSQAPRVAATVNLAALHASVKSAMRPNQPKVSFC